MPPLRIFPLSNVVLFPRVRTPLHMFEARYRQLTRDAVADDRQIGMVVVPPLHTGDMGGNPPVFPVGCAGVIRRAERLDDGHYNVVLLGTNRFRILGEEPPDGERLYRLAEVEALEDPYDKNEIPRVTALRSRVIELLEEFAQSADPEASGSFSPNAFAGVDDATFVNGLANAFPFDAAEKQGLLEADGIAARAERLVAALRFRVAQIRSGGPPDAASVH